VMDNESGESMELMSCQRVCLTRQK